MISTNTDDLYREIHRLQKLIHGAEHESEFYYPPGVVDKWKHKLDQLLDQDIQQRPHILRNGGRSL